MKIDRRHLNVGEDGKADVLLLTDPIPRALSIVDWGANDTPAASWKSVDPVVIAHVLRSPPAGDVVDRVRATPKALGMFVVETMMAWTSLCAIGVTEAASRADLAATIRGYSSQASARLAATAKALGPKVKQLACELKPKKKNPDESIKSIRGNASHIVNRAAELFGAVAADMASVTVALMAESDDSTEDILAAFAIMTDSLCSVVEASELDESVKAGRRHRKTDLEALRSIKKQIESLLAGYDLDEDDEPKKSEKRVDIVTGLDRLRNVGKVPTMTSYQFNGVWKPFRLVNVQADGFQVVGFVNGRQVAKSVVYKFPSPAPINYGEAFKYKVPPEKLEAEAKLNAEKWARAWRAKQKRIHATTASVTVRIATNSQSAANGFDPATMNTSVGDEMDQALKAATVRMKTTSAGNQRFKWRVYGANKAGEWGPWTTDTSAGMYAQAEIVEGGRVIATSAKFLYPARPRVTGERAGAIEYQPSQAEQESAAMEKAKAWGEKYVRAYNAKQQRKSAVDGTTRSGEEMKITLDDLRALADENPMGLTTVLRSAFEHSGVPEETVKFMWGETGVAPFSADAIMQGLTMVGGEQFQSLIQGAVGGIALEGAMSNSPHVASAFKSEASTAFQSAIAEAVKSELAREGSPLLEAITKALAPALGEAIVETMNSSSGGGVSPSAFDFGNDEDDDSLLGQDPSQLLR